MSMEYFRRKQLYPITHKGGIRHDASDITLRLTHRRK
jgi:hypothetical protein